METNSSWHKVLPHIDDPDLAPHNAAREPMPKAGGTNLYAPPVLRQPSAPHNTTPGPKKSFFANHKLAIIVSAVILIILIVILYMYFTRRDKKPKDEASGETSGGGTKDEMARKPRHKHAANLLEGAWRLNP